MIPFMGDSQEKQIHRDESGSVVAGDVGGGDGDGV